MHPVSTVEHDWWLDTTIKSNEMCLGLSNIRSTSLHCYQTSTSSEFISHPIKVDTANSHRSISLLIYLLHLEISAGHNRTDVNVNGTHRLLTSVPDRIGCRSYGGRKEGVIERRKRPILSNRWIKSPQSWIML